MNRILLIEVPVELDGFTILAAMGQAALEPLGDAIEATFGYDMNGEPSDSEDGEMDCIRVTVARS